MTVSVLNPDVFSIGPFTIKWYAVIIVMGVLLAAYLSDKEAKRKALPKDFISDLLFFLLPIGIIGARLYYLVFQWENYQHNVLSVFYIWEGGIAIYGGLLAGLATIIWYARRFKVSSWLILDIITPTVLLAQAIGRWGNFVNQEAHGSEVARQFLESLYLPDFIIEQMFINGHYYEPTFLYESLLSFLGFIVLMLVRRHVKSLRIGDMTLFYIVWYGIERFFVEGLRTDSLWLGPIRVSQGLSLVLIVLSVIMYVYRKHQEIALYHDFVYQQSPE